MFHKACDVAFREGTILDVTFQNGYIKRFDMSSLFGKYPQLRALDDRDLFLSGKLMGFYGIIWNDELDIEIETIYEKGVVVGRMDFPSNQMLADSILTARAKAGLSQKQVAELTGIDQSDISKIERGLSNPSVSTLERIADALGGKLTISIEIPA